mgnify:CR=1 FL=1
MSLFSSTSSFAFLFLLACLSAPAANGEVGEFDLPDVIPIPMGAVQELRELVRTDAEAQEVVAELSEEAERYLMDEPTPLRVIHYEGLVNTDPKRIDTVEKLRQAGHAGTLVKYWQATGDSRAEATLRKWIDAWFSTYELTGNDVNENKLFPMLVGYDYLRDTFRRAERERIDRFVRELGELHVRAVKESSHFTNRYTKHVRLAAICGMILGKSEWVELAHEGVQRYVSESLYGDGETRDLRHRDTLTYHSSSLRPAIQLAMLSGTRGKSLYAWENERGGSLEKSVDYVVPYALGEKVHREWVDSKVRLDQRRAEAGIEKYQIGSLYDPQHARQLMEQAAFFDPDLMRVVQHLGKGEAERFPTWQTLVNAAMNLNLKTE